MASPQAYTKLARVKQWTKGAFILLGPLYGGVLTSGAAAVPVIAAFMAFALASSGCYVLNDLKDVEADRNHPRKRSRPIAAGVISRGAAGVFAVVLFLGAIGAMLAIPGGEAHRWARELVGGAVLLYVLNVTVYTFWLKHAPVLDVMSLALGFVLRTLGGCAAVGVEPSTWLLNCTFFLSMFLALGKRLGERHSLGDAAADARGVQALYTTDVLRAATSVTAFATLLSYSDYVQAQAEAYTRGFNLLWLTLLPATYGLLRSMLMVERGVYDDPTELAYKDRPFQVATLVFGVMTVAMLVYVRKVVGPM